MAKIVPFRGLHYNPGKISDLSRVIAPPYDLITPQLQDELYRRSPYNVVRLVRGKDAEGDDERFNRYSRAAAEFEKWQNAHVLLRERQRVLYLCDQQYETEGGETVVRHGFTALARIEDFATGMVKPHEVTTAEAKADRFQLIKACSANFSPVFSLYSDPCSVLEALTRKMRQEPPDVEVTDDDGVINRLWKVTDPSMVGKIQSLLNDKPLFIADGHHRYETALAHRDFLREKYPDYAGREVFNYVMMFFDNLEDPGVRIYPIHRGVKLPAPFDLEGFLARLKSFFTIEVRSFDAESEAAREQVLAELADRGQSGHALALYAGNSRLYFLTLLDESAMEPLFTKGTSKALRTLDVSILHKLILQHVLGLSDGNGSDEAGVHFFTRARECLAGVSRDDLTLAFLMNPTGLKEVRDIANAGEKMPRKSTYFYPQLLTGLVINPIVGRETVDD